MIRKKDYKFVALCAASLALSGLFIRESRLVSDMLESGFRKIDIKAVMRLIKKGELVEHEAMYYRSEAPK